MTPEGHVETKPGDFIVVCYNGAHGWPGQVGAFPHRVIDIRGNVALIGQVGNLQRVTSWIRLRPKQPTLLPS